jgi:hypothetical protein
VFEAGGADPEPGEIIDRVEQRAAELERERTVVGPSERREGERERKIGERGDRRERRQTAAGTRRRARAKAAERGEPIGRQPMKDGRRGGEREQQPQEPHGPVGPERQREQRPRIGENARIGRPRAIGRVERERHDDGEAEQVGDAQPHRALADEPSAPLAGEGGSGEQAGEEEHQRHQIDVLPRAEQVEAEPARCVEERKGPPVPGGCVEGEAGRLGEAEVGKRRMEGEQEEDGEPPQIAQRETRTAGRARRRRQNIRGGFDRPVAHRHDGFPLPGMRGGSPFRDGGTALRTARHGRHRARRLDLDKRNPSPKRAPPSPAFAG